MRGGRLAHTSIDVLTNSATGHGHVKLMLLYSAEVHGPCTFEGT